GGYQSDARRCSGGGNRLATTTEQWRIGYLPARARTRDAADLIRAVALHQLGRAAAHAAGGALHQRLGSGIEMKTVHAAIPARSTAFCKALSRSNSTVIGRPDCSISCLAAAKLLPINRATTGTLICGTASSAASSSCANSPRSVMPAKTLTSTTAI